MVNLANPKPVQDLGFIAFDVGAECLSRGPSVFYRSTAWYVNVGLELTSSVRFFPNMVGWISRPAFKEEYRTVEVVDFFVMVFPQGKQL